MAAPDQLDELLDEWEDWQDEHPDSSVEHFVDHRCRGLPAPLVAAFRDRVERLAGMDARIASIGSADTDAGVRAGDDTADFTPLAGDLQPGMEPVPGYELVERLGKGGFGEVWKATSPGGFSVALKFVATEGRAGDVELRSLETMKEVRHPHLLAIFGAWQRGSRLVIATELADRTLLDRFREASTEGHTGIPREELLEYLTEASKGIDFLNQPKAEGGHGIQHRDIKPQNILLSGGSIKVGDFGLARSLDRSATDHTGSLTLAYAAPEFLEGRTSDRSDQYSLAMTWCYLRSGKLPFEGTPAQIVSGHLNRAPDLSSLPEVERAVLQRALAKSPADRWPSCTAFARAMQNAHSPGAQQTPTRLTKPGRHFAALANHTATRVVITVAVLSTAFLAFLVLRGDSGPDGHGPTSGSTTSDRGGDSRPASLEDALRDFPLGVISVEAVPEWSVDSDGVAASATMSVDVAAYRKLLDGLDGLLADAATESGTGWLSVSESLSEISYGGGGLPEATQSTLMRTMKDTAPGTTTFLIVCHDSGNHLQEGGDRRIVVNWYLLEGQPARTIAEVWGRLEGVSMEARLLDDSQAIVSRQVDFPFRGESGLIRTPGGISQRLGWEPEVYFAGTNPERHVDGRWNAPIFVLPFLVAPKPSRPDLLSFQSTSTIPVNFALSPDEAAKARTLEVSLRR